MGFLALYLVAAALVGSVLAVATGLSCARSYWRRARPEVTSVGGAAAAPVTWAHSLGAQTSSPGFGGGRPASPATWALIVAALAAAAVAGWARGAILGGSGPTAVALFGGLLAAAVAARGLVRWLARRDNPVAAARRKAAAGDPDGAVADLLALLDRRWGRPAAPEPLADDPWAPPHSQAR